MRERERKHWERQAEKEREKGREREQECEVGVVVRALLKGNLINVHRCSYWLKIRNLQPVRTPRADR